MSDCDEGDSERPRIPRPPALPKEAVDHPAHYGGADNQYETIKVLAAWMLDGVFHFAIGNAIKYLSRAGKKQGASQLEDLQKARWYIDYAITYLREKQPKT